MKPIDFFTLIFYSLDSFYDDNPSEELGRFLSEMSPVTFEGEGSADPAVFSEFLNFLNNQEINIENSYSVAIEYLRTFKNIDVVTPFVNMNEEKWQEGCKKYLTVD